VYNMVKQDPYENEHEHHTHSHTHKGLFDEDTENTLREILCKLDKKLEDILVLSEADCQTCGEADVLARELMRLSCDRLVFRKISREDEIAVRLKTRYVPAFIYDTPSRNIRYYGLPSGQEFAPFIYIHQYISSGKIKISREVVENIEAIENPLHIKIFVTPECPYCPIVVDEVNQMALINNNLLVDTIEAIENPLEADIYGVMYVPTIVVTDPAKQTEYGAKPIEVINGYLPAEDLSKILYDISRKSFGKQGKQQ